MTINEALEVVRGEMFGLGTMSHTLIERVDAMAIIQPILEAAGKMNEAHATTIPADMIVRVPITKWQADLLSAAALPGEPR